MIIQGIIGIITQNFWMHGESHKKEKFVWGMTQIFPWQLVWRELLYGLATQIR